MAAGVNRHVVSMHHVVTDVHPDTAHRYIYTCICWWYFSLPSDMEPGGKGVLGVSQLWSWRFKSSEKWCCFIGCILSDGSKYPSPFTLRDKQ